MQRATCTLHLWVCETLLRLINPRGTAANALERKIEHLHVVMELDARLSEAKARLSKAVAELAINAFREHGFTEMLCTLFSY